MLGRLTRYLRMLGCDVEVGGREGDHELLTAARAKNRVLLTRDRALGRERTQVVLLEAMDLAGQLAEVRRAWPGLPTAPSFQRCTACNGKLAPDPAAEGSGADPGATRARSEGRPIWRCERCGHRYWEGSHTRRIREDLRRWLPEGTP